MPLRTAGRNAWHGPLLSRDKLRFGRCALVAALWSLRFDMWPPMVAGGAKLSLTYWSLDSNKYLPTTVLDVSTWRGDRRANHWNASRFRIWSSGT